MRKTLSVLAAACSAFVLAAEEAPLLSYAPREYSAVISVDLRRLRENPEIGKRFSAPGAVKLLAELERSGLDVGAVPALAVFYWSERWFCVMRVGDVARLCGELDRHCSGADPDATPLRVGKLRAYRINHRKKPGQSERKRGKELCVVIPGGGVVVVAKLAEVKDFLATPKLGDAYRREFGDRDAALWCEYRRRDAFAGESDESGVVDMRLRQGSLTLAFFGADKRDVEINGVARFSDADSARSIGMTLPGVLAFFVGLVCSDDPGAGDAIVRALRCRTEGSTAYLSLRLPDGLFRRFAAGLDGLLGGDGDGGRGVPKRAEEAK